MEIRLVLTNVCQLHRLQLPIEAPHISTIAFDTEQELLWIGDETVSIAATHIYNGIP